MKTILISILTALTSGIAGYFIGDSNDCTYPCYPPCLNTLAYEDCHTDGNNHCTRRADPLTIINSDSARRSVRRYGQWAGRTAQIIEQQSPDSIWNYIQFPAGWTIPIKELWEDVHGIDSLRAYLAIKDTDTTIYGIPKIELIVALVDQNGQDKEYSCYHNLVRPCPHMCNKPGLLYTEYDTGLVEGRGFSPHQ